ncbi:MAG: HAMP domain-containing sensor histidine kinase [Bacteroidota bacterium]
MKLQFKLALYNALSKALIIAAIGLFLPVILKKVVYTHIDQRLRARVARMMLEVERGGIREIIMDQDCSFSDYTIFKEEYVSIKPLSSMPQYFGKEIILDAERNIDNEIVKHRVLSKSFIYDNQLYELEVGEGVHDIESLTDTFHKYTIWFLVCVVLLFFFIDIFYGRVLLIPFYKIVNQKLQAVQHPSTFKPEKVKTNTYEFSYLDTSINEMMKKVQDAFEIEREFITNVSHELLTPISILQTRCENILADPKVSSEIAIKMVDSQKTLTRLSRIVKALLYISKIENRQFLKEENVLLKSLVTDVLDEIEERIASKNIKVHQQWNSDFEVRNCNRSLLQTMFFNLVSNAVKYNKENGEILIIGHQDEDKNFILTIKDTGVGIAKENIEFVFDRFKRFRPEDGSSFGLGLPIVRTIADFHDLKINVDSTLNSGSGFSVIFPFTA